VTGLTGVRLTPGSTATDNAGRVAAVSAPVRDALWLLARQYQTAALEAEDGGSPVTVTMAHVQAPLHLDAELRGPIEPIVEAEPLPAADDLDTATRVRYATELLRLLGDAGLPETSRDDVRTALSAAFPLGVRGASDALTAYPGQLPDAAAMYSSWRADLGPDGGSGSLPTIPGLDASPALTEAARTWVAWMTARIGPAFGAPARWAAETLGYTAQLTADLGGQLVTLTAADYDGAGLRWHALDRTALASAPTASAQPVAVRPTRVSYPGMPEPGYWTFENGDVNLGILASDNPAQALLVSFAQSYANDWFLVPLSVDPGVVLVTEMTVVDSFGTTTAVPAAAAVDAGRTRFRLWETGISATGDGAPATADPGIGLTVVLPGSPPPLESPVLEDVVVTRDELANIGWLIELTTTDGDGRRIDRYQRWLSLRHGDRSSGGPAQSYRLGTAVPDHWYPLEVAESGADGHRRLRLAAVPPGATDVPDTGVQGRVLDHHPGTAIDEEKAARTGTRIARIDRLTYGPAGRVVWRARRVSTGLGEASSGLQFDVISDID